MPREAPSSGIVFLADKIAVYSCAGGITGESNENRLEDPFAENGAAALQDGFPDQPNCVSVESSVANVCPGVKSNIVTELSLLRKRARKLGKKIWRTTLKNFLASPMARFHTPHIAKTRTLGIRMCTRHALFVSTKKQIVLKVAFGTHGEV